MLRLDQIFDEVLDLEEKNGAVHILFDGAHRILSRPDILRLLEIEALWPRKAAPVPSAQVEPHLVPSQPTRTLAGLGKLAAVLRKKSKGKLGAGDQRRLQGALEAFDGPTGGRRTTQVAAHLMAIRAGKIEDGLAHAIDAFLAAHPELLAVKAR